MRPVIALISPRLRTAMVACSISLLLLKAKNVALTSFIMLSLPLRKCITYSTITRSLWHPFPQSRMQYLSPREAFAMLLPISRSTLPKRKSRQSRFLALLADLGMTFLMAFLTVCPLDSPRCLVRLGRFGRVLRAERTDNVAVAKRDMAGFRGEIVKAFARLQ
jgi:hypothetical protein